jgi:hypothetical protein
VSHGGIPDAVAPGLDNGVGEQGVADVAHDGRPGELALVLGRRAGTAPAAGPVALLTRIAVRWVELGESARPAARALDGQPLGVGGVGHGRSLVGCNDRGPVLGGSSVDDQTPSARPAR